MSVRLSVVIPVYNQAERLLLTLASLRHQCPGDYSAEVVLVDDGSNDGSAEVAAGVPLPFPRAVVRSPSNQGRSAARNRGVEAAAGDVILFLDGDMIAAPDLLAKHASYHQTGRAWTVTGATRFLRVYSCLYPDDTDFRRRLTRFAATRPTLAARLHEIERARPSGPIQLFGPEQVESGEYQQWSFQLASAACFDQLVREYGPELVDFPMGWATVFTGNLSVPKAVLKDVGLFDEGFRGWGYEDQDLGFRLHLAGYGHCCALDADSYHQEHPSSHDERLASGRENFARLCRKHPDLRIWTLGFSVSSPYWNVRILGRVLLDYQHLSSYGGVPEAMTVFPHVVARQAVRFVGDEPPVDPTPLPADPLPGPSAALTSELKARAPWFYRALDYAAKNGLWPGA